MEFSDEIWDVVSNIYHKNTLLPTHMNAVFENAVLTELKKYGIEDARFCSDCNTVMRSESFYTSKHGYCKKCMERRKHKLFGGHWKEVVESTNAKCALCGDCYEHVHHVIPTKNGGTNELNNLVPLCNKCHHEAHSKYISTKFKINLKTLIDLQSLGYAKSFTNLILYLQNEQVESNEVS